VLERRRFRRVGGDRDISVNVRVLSATHRDLRAEVNQGTFRGDLYFRLAVARLALPPLRERKEDIPALVEHFQREITGNSEATPFSRATMDALMSHHWSGNVRELRNVVESALLMGRVALESSGEGPAAKEAGKAPLESYRDARAKALELFEKEYVERLITECDGNASEAARRAKMDRGYLLTLLKRHQLR
jgi:DNA-binding NtrC family response regulator